MLQPRLVNLSVKPRKTETMRNIIIDISERPRPSLVTPAKGSEGDMVDETQAAACSIDAIIKRYGGNLPPAKGWTDGGVQLPLNRDELEDMAYKACEDIVNNGKSPFKSVDEAITALSDGTFAEKVANYNPTEPKEPIAPTVPKEPIAPTIPTTPTEPTETKE